MIPSELCTGNEIIDKQHDDLLREVELLNRVIKEEDHITTKSVMEFINFLRNHFTNHFNDEETLMHEVKYPRWGEHVDEHLKFFDTFVQHKARIERYGATTENVQDLVNSLLTWMTTHIMEKDVWIAKFIRGEEIPKQEEYQRGY